MRQPVVIYGYRKLGCKTYFYIGSTKENAEVRALRHLRQAKKGTHENKKLAHLLLTSNFQIDILETVNEHNRWIKEYEWISKSLKKKHKLVNSRNPLKPRQHISTMTKELKNDRKASKTH